MATQLFYFLPSIDLFNPSRSSESYQWNLGTFGRSDDHPNDRQNKYMRHLAYWYLARPYGCDSDWLPRFNWMTAVDAPMEELEEL